MKRWHERPEDFRCGGTDPGALGHVIGMGAAVLLVVLLAPPVKAMPEPTRVEIHGVPQVTCKHLYKGKLDVARTEGAPVWVWSDEDPRAPSVPALANQPSAGTQLTRLEYTVASHEKPSPRPPAPYAVASDATAEPPPGACGFALNVLHVLAKSR